MSIVGEPSDAVLIASVLSGDTDAFAVLLARYRDAYTRFAVRMLGSIEDADDALQLAFLRAYRHLATCREPERFRAWLFQIVVNECRTFGTRRGRREIRLVHDELAMETIAVVGSAPDVFLRAEIQRALDLLDVEQREAFVLKHVEDLSYDEMASLTGVGVSALKMRVKRACDRLRELLEGVHQ